MHTSKSTHSASGVSRDKGRRRLYPTVLTLLLAGLVLLVLLAACGGSEPEPTQAPAADTAIPTEAPAADGLALLETRCVACHGVDRTTGAAKTAAEWEQTVTRMIGKGAQLTEPEKAVLVEYLANTYGP